MGEKKLDYTKKDTWSENHLPIIARDLGNVLNDKFTDAFRIFTAQTIAKAKVTHYLFIVATNFFNTVKPPLEKTNGRH